MRDPFADLHDYLLPKTLEWVLGESTFYRQHLGAAAARVSGLADLPKLPLLTKDVAIANQQAMRCGGAPVQIGTLSSGTTRQGAGVLWVERTEAELEALHQLSEVQRRKGGGGIADELSMVLHAPYHAAPRPKFGSELTLAFAPDAPTFRVIVTALQKDYDGRRVKSLRGSSSQVKQLTAFLLQQGVPPSELGLTNIFCAGSRLTPRWRALISKAWGARVREVFGLSELQATCLECETCGAHHWGVPPQIAELVDPFTHEVIDGPGRGLLVLTSLYPYTQRQPLIRYVTGDIVERIGVCPRDNELGYRFYGRARESVLRRNQAGRADYLLSPIVLEDTCDALPWVARHVLPSERLGVLPPGTCGQPKIRAALGDDEQVRVDVGVTFDPRLFPDRVAALNAELDFGATVTLHAPDDDDGGWFVKHTT